MLLLQKQRYKYPEDVREKIHFPHPLNPTLKLAFIPTVIII